MAKLHADAIIPKRANPGDAGFDLSSIGADDIGRVVVPARGRALVDTGLAIEIDASCYGRIAPRSGLAVKHGICVGAGVVDSSYRGPVKVLLFNHSDTDFIVNPGDRIAQIIFEQIESLYDLTEVSHQEMCTSDRGSGGFGSTGVARP